MSKSSVKGYTAEHLVMLWYLSLGIGATRPRTTSYTSVDTGDIHGPPWVTSIKNHKRMSLAEWVDELQAMVARSPWDTGFIVHKRVRKGQAGDWYVTLPLDLMRPFITAYLAIAKPRGGMSR